MKNSGFMKVFKFSYEQSMKSKSTKITIAIFVAIALLFLPVKTLISGGLDSLEDDNKTQIETVYVDTDNEELFNNLVSVVNAELEEDATFTMIGEKEYDETIKKLENKESNDLYLKVNFDEDETSLNFGLSYKLVYGNGKNAEEIAGNLDSILMDKSKDMVIAYYGIDEETAKTLVHSEYDVKMYDVDGNEIKGETGLNDAEYWFTYGVIMVLIIIASFIGSSVAEGIVSEKANRVIEYIMITLKPMDLIVGKVLSGMATLFTMVGSALLAFVASTYINKAIDSDAETVFQMMKGFVDDGTLKGVSIINILIVIAIIFAGSYFYSILGGLSGGMVSKIEEMSEGLKVYMIFLFIGVYAAIFLMTSDGWGTFSYIVYWLPMSSMFIIPSYLLIGRIETWVALVGLLITFVVAALLTALASRIFGQMLYHNGSPLKIKDIVSMTKEGKKHEK